MQDLLKILFDEIRGAWRYRWTALLVAWAICLGGWFFVNSLPNIYEARAQVYVDAESRLAEVMGQVGVSRGVGSRVFVVRQAMLGRPQIERVANETEYDLRATTPEKLEGLYNKLGDKIVIRTGRSSQSRNLYTITFEDHDRNMAIAVVTALLNAFVEDVLKLKEQGTDEVDDYLDSQLNHYSGLLREAEQGLADFKKENVGLLPGASGGIFEKLQLQMSQLQQAELDFRVETDRREELRRQIQNENPLLPDSGDGNAGVNVPGSLLATQISDLVKKRSDLLLSFTERHPDVIALDEQLQQLYDQQRRERAAMVRGGTGMEGAVNATNPVYQTVQIALNDSSVKIAGLQSKVRRHRSIVAEYRGQIDIIPQVEAELATLTRDYDQYRALYNEIMVRKERERMGKVGSDNDVVSFNVTEPPTAALDPIGPKRTLMLSATLIFALGAGGCIAFLMSQLNPVFHDVSGLRKYLGYPVLGQINMTSSSERQKVERRNALAFGVAASGLMLLFVVVVVLQGPAARVVRSLLGPIST
jgi:polysaccharide chain length determinant protein (PEP-CTERM system associated)